MNACNNITLMKYDYHRCCEVDKPPWDGTPFRLPSPPLFGSHLLVGALRILDSLDHLPTHLGCLVESGSEEVWRSAVA